ncbi:MAG: ABC transporter permease [Acetobacter malorum]|uniref:ABC transporter permease n=1 Tax=Acetobacter malorum TaxID=178901 RepID=UPI0039E93BDB
MSASVTDGYVSTRSAWSVRIREGLGLPARIASRSAALVALACVWELLSRTGIINPLFLPPFSVVIADVYHGFVTGYLGQHVVASLGRAVPGLLLALLVGVPLGLALEASRSLKTFIDPVVEVLRNTSALALLPVFTLMMGIGETSKIAMVFYAALWPILLGTMNGLRGVDPLWIKAGRSMGLSGGKLFIKIVIPASLPSIFTGIRLAAAAGLLVLVAAEMVGSRAGLGYVINASQLDFDLPGMYAAILVLSVVGYVTNAALVRVEAHFLQWKTS